MHKIHVELPHKEKYLEVEVKYTMHQDCIDEFKVYHESKDITDELTNEQIEAIDLKIYKYEDWRL